MDEFPQFPNNIYCLPSQQVLIDRTRHTCQYVSALLQEEEIDGVRLKALGDQLEAAVDEMDLFSRTNVPQEWVMATVEHIQQLLNRVRQVQNALLEE